MSPVIYCGVNPFTLNQTILIINDSAQEVVNAPTVFVAQTIAELCSNRDITEVRLAGVRGYAEKMAEEIKTAYTTKYNNNKTLNIEVVR